MRQTCPGEASITMLAEIVRLLNAGVSITTPQSSFLEVRMGGGRSPSCITACSCELRCWDDAAAYGVRRGCAPTLVDRGGDIISDMDAQAHNATNAILAVASRFRLSQLGARCDWEGIGRIPETSPPFADD